MRRDRDAAMRRIAAVLGRLEGDTLESRVVRCAILVPLAVAIAACGSKRPTSPCGSDSTCTMGFCSEATHGCVICSTIEIPPNSGHCTSDNDCYAEHFCSAAGVCAAPVCQQCDGKHACGSPDSCLRFAGSQVGTCLTCDELVNPPSPLTSATCSTTGDCFTGQVCTMGICVCQQ